MTLSDELRAAHASTWDAAVGHRFVEELWTGTLDDAVLARYLIQDLQFVDAFVALLGQAVASADRPGPRMTIARQLGLMAGAEDDYFDRALDRLGVGLEHRTDVLLAPPTRDFVAIMEEVRRRGEYAEIVALLVVAEWLYLDWAGRDAFTPSDWLHREWIELHRGAAFESWVRFLRGELDRVAGPDDEQVASTFARAVELERAFFDAAYDPVRRSDRAG